MYTFLCKPPRLDRCQAANGVIDTPNAALALGIIRSLCPYGAQKHGILESDVHSGGAWIGTLRYRFDLTLAALFHDKLTLLRLFIDFGKILA